MADGKKNTPVAEGADDIVQRIPRACADEEAAVELMEELRFGDDPFCPRSDCASTDVYKMTKRGRDERNERYLWRCRDCGRQFTVRIGTVMEDSPIPLKVWCYAFWRACTSKKGVSAKEIERQTGLSYKSALFLMHRIRLAMNGAGSNGGMMGQGGGTVEVDETYVGGKPRKRTKASKAYRELTGRDFKPGRTADFDERKTPVMALVDRAGEARAKVLTKISADNLKGAIRENVDRSARIVTDQRTQYRNIGPEFDGGHETVNHSEKEWARGDVTTNTVEAFFAILKRGVYGIWHNVSKKHLHRYVGAAAFRWSTRGLSDGDRTAAAIRGAEGKRLTYRPLVG